MLIPAAYAEKYHPEQYNGYKYTNEYLWNLSTVQTILNRREYLGHTVLHKSAGTNFKLHKRKATTEAEQYVFPNTHEAIITQELWDSVQERRKRVNRSSPRGTHHHRLCGFLFCADCGRQLTLQTHYAKKSKAVQYSFRCGGYASQISKCTGHSITATTLEAVLLDAVQCISRHVIEDEAAFAGELQSMWLQKQSAKPKQDKSELKRLQKRYDDLSALVRGLYENLMNGMLPERQYKQLMKQYDDEQAEIEEKLSRLEEVFDADEEKRPDTQKFISIIRKYTAPAEVSDVMLRELVDKIVVHEAEGNGNARTQQVDIFFKYVGQINIAYAKAKRINLILVKDLSRFGRNYIEFGQYTDYLFPSIGCRFVALNNGIDTESTNGSTDVMCFLNLFNEFYSRDTSKKVKAVKRACAESGKFMGTYPAYGYRRDPMDKHHLIIDEETAPTVRRIFAMRTSGMGYRAIACRLNEEGILPPGVLYYQRKGQSDPRNVNHQWAEETIKSILCKEVYLGHMVQGRYGTLSYKSRKIISKPEDEWIRVENTHEPLVSQEIWDTCASLAQKKVRKTRTADGIQSIFTGLVYCADCGFKMRNLIERFTYKDGRPGRYSSFICGNYARSGKNACSTHTISENALNQLILADIKEKARFASCDRARLVEQITRLKAKETFSRLASLEQELKSTSNRLAELERLMQNLYEDKCSGTVPQAVFQTLMKKYEAERAEKAAALPELESKVKAQQGHTQDAGRWSEIISRYTEITALDESILFELVDRIEVGNAQIIEGQRVCDVRVVYRYVGNVDTAVAEGRQGGYDQAI